MSRDMMVLFILLLSINIMATGNVFAQSTPVFQATGTETNTTVHAAVEKDPFIVEWNRTFERGSDVDLHLLDINQTVDGGYIITGERINFASTEGLLIKTDSYGNKIWDKVIAHNGSFVRVFQRIKPKMVVTCC